MQIPTQNIEKGCKMKHVERSEFERIAVEEIYRRFEAPSVIQLGSRAISRNANSVRDLFPRTAKFTGVDFINGEGVDVCADCHTMSDQLGCGSVDVIWSDATLEHLSHVWLAVAEMARVLRTGGIAVHITHQTFPVHGFPNDYWRFTTDAMGILFCEQAGFRLLASDYCWPITIQPSPALPALSPCFVHTLVMAEKISEPSESFDLMRSEFYGVNTERKGVK